MRKKNIVCFHLKNLIFLILLSISSVNLQAQTAQSNANALNNFMWSLDGEWASNYPFNPQELKERKIRSVIATYGMPQIKAGNFDYNVSSVTKPWSSWFFPLSSEELFDGQNAPLTKYDSLVSRSNYQISPNRSAAVFFRENVYKREAHDWEGFCAPLAYASIFHKLINRIERPKLVNGICFTPRDLKALLLITYNNVNADATGWNGRYGQPFTNEDGPLGRAAVPRDIYPAEWHRFVQAQLAERKLPFIMDADSGPAVWKYAVFRAYGTIERVTNRQYEDMEIARVTMNVQFAKTQLSDDEQEKDKKENIGSIVITKRYTYELYGRWQENDFILVAPNTTVSGRWAGLSRTDHPDYVEELPIPPGKEYPKHGNPTFEAAENDYNYARNFITKLRQQPNALLNVSIVDELIMRASRNTALSCDPDSNFTSPTPSPAPLPPPYFRWPNSN